MNFIPLALILVPLIAAILAGMTAAKQARLLALLGCGLTLVLGLAGLFATGTTEPLSGTLSVPWMPALGIGFHLGMDGPAASLAVLTAFLGLMAAVFSPALITTREKEYYATLLALVGTVIGAFLALDLVLFYIFFEICLVPAYFLIGIWGGRDRIRAATKFFVYTVVGSLVMLVSIIALYLKYSTFDIIEIHTRALADPLPPLEAALIFGGFALAFAVKTGLFPFHTWLPDAYAEAPAPVTALLSGAMAKLGTYGFYRFGLYLLPDAAADWAPFLAALGTVSILYGALVAAAQKDAKRVLAYSSISHLGFVVAGLFAFNQQGVGGAFLQQFNHGIISGGLFLALGLIAARRGTTKLVALGGLWEQTPRLSRIFLILTLASVALPLTSGFIGEFLILLGLYRTFPMLGTFATLGVIGSAIYMLVLFQKAMFGPVDKAENRRLRDLTGGEVAALVPFIVLIFLLGILPAPLLERFAPAVQSVVRPLEERESLAPLAAVRVTPEVAEDNKP